MSKQRVSHEDLTFDVENTQRLSDCGYELGRIGLYALDLLDARRDLAASEAGIRAIGSAMGSDRLTAIEIERLIHEGNAKSTQMYTDLAETRDKLAASEQRVAELEAWNEWPNESNEAEYPPDETPVLIYCGSWDSKDFIVGQISKRSGTYGPSGATHWKPINAPCIAAQRQKEGE